MNLGQSICCKIKWECFGKSDLETLIGINNWRSGLAGTWNANFKRKGKINRWFNIWKETLSKFCGRVNGDERFLMN
jgi:hypothetical protein